MQVHGILETALHVADLARSIAFYKRLFDFEAMVEDDRFCALNVSGRNVLLLFKQGSSIRPTAMPGGLIPPHGSAGQLHFAFSIAAADLPSWEARLVREGVELESRVTWPRGATSLYFRDPDQHLVELVTPGIWPIY